ncbi:sigma-54-dependent Fis family transcriptional regulator [Desulfosediminicola ganghwensis]|uniref:sigma-54-dependent Fis family transcriptional regulator n=1 Tax=Desulfosediminicola ganghwensis TaxID=2569540 RepID=UPI001C3C6287|nr:sigma-54-dependent Fis family transcriptional regulator [Desulfosediminicola ganghwensis]
MRELHLKDLLKVDSETKIISFLDQRVLIGDSISRGLLRKELIQVFGEYGAKNVLTRYGYAHGWRTAEMLKSKSPKLFHATKGGAHLHMLYGLVFTTAISETDGESDQPLIHSRLEHSYEAEQHLMHFGVADEAVCWTLTGFASGYESFKRQKDVYFLETKCIGKGDEYCEMEGRYAEKWGSTLQTQLPFYGMASTNDILEELTSRIRDTEQQLKKTRHSLEHLERKRTFLEGMVVRSKAMQDVVDLASRTARVNSPVLITGESGVGKEVLARYIHNTSCGGNKPFIAVNCGAFSETLLESELFGYTKGAFTGAERDHKGVFEEAEGGTLFLDEIGETSLKMQVKLLRVLQEKEIRRIGENGARKVKVRIISATNKVLTDEIKGGNFRQDLYYRLRVIELTIPSLRKRAADILPLAHCFLKEAAHEMQSVATGFSSAAAESLLQYNWPGNVRELQNVIYRAAALCDRGMITRADLPVELRQAEDSYTGSEGCRTLRQLEKDHIKRTLELAGGDKREAAKLLGIGLATLYRKLKAH